MVLCGYFRCHAVRRCGRVSSLPSWCSCSLPLMTAPACLELRKAGEIVDRSKSLRRSSAQLISASNLRLLLFGSWCSPTHIYASTSTGLWPCSRVQEFPDSKPSPGLLILVHVRPTPFLEHQRFVCPLPSPTATFGPPTIFPVRLAATRLLSTVCMHSPPCMPHARLFHVELSRPSRFPLLITRAEPQRWLSFMLADTTCQGFGKLFE